MTKEKAVIDLIEEIPKLFKWGVESVKKSEELAEVNRALMTLLKRIVEVEDSNGMGVIGWPEVMDDARKFLDKMGDGEADDG